MAERLPDELHAFRELARAAASGPYDPDALVERICRELKTSFGLARADFLAADAVAARHPLVERARAERRAVADGRRVAVPLVADDRCLGFLIGDADGGELTLGDADLQLLTALATVAAVFVAKADAHGRLERSLDARTHFVSLASHELRTPIAVVHGVVSTLHLRGDGLPPERVRDLRRTAYEQTKRLAVLAEQLLDLSRLEAGAVAARRCRLRPRALVEELVDRLAPDRADDVEVEIDPQLELSADPDALERVLSNLIVNALRHGRPPVRVVADESGLAVEDSGEGIDTELVPRLFDRFSRGRSGGGGAGLGLSIARAYAEALGGTLEYEPVEPHGSRFALRLPRAGVRV